MHTKWKPLISQLSKGVDPVELLNSLYFGIEVEFSDAGELGSGESECPYTEDDAIERLNDSAADILASQFGEHDSSAYRIFRSMLRHANLETIINECTGSSWSDLVDSELTSMTENWEPDDDDGEFSDVDGWNYGPDGTSGIVVEYRTDHPCNWEEMEERVNELFNLAGDGIEVPTFGSTHVHVSVPGVKHQTESSDSFLHCCILFELSQLVDEFPECIHERIEAGDRYFTLNAGSGGKYTAVHFHSQGSIEFRLFGHCETAEDALKCVEIAGIAFLRGYARYFAKAYEIEDCAEFRELFAESIRSKTPILSSAILPFMPMASVLCAACCQTDGIAESERLPLYASSAQITIADEYRNPWFSPESDAESLWSNPDQFLCELRNGQRLTLRRVEIEGTIAYVDSLANEGDTVDGYGPAIHGHRVWSSDDSPADIIRFRRQTVSGGVI